MKNLKSKNTSLLLSILAAIALCSCGKSQDLDRTIDDFEKASSDLIDVLSEGPDLHSPSQMTNLAPTVRRWTSLMSTLHESRAKFTQSQRERLQTIQARAVTALTANMSEESKKQFIDSLSQDQKAKLDAIANSDQTNK
jgi:hypothetical protein